MPIDQLSEQKSSQISIYEQIRSIIHRRKSYETDLYIHPIPGPTAGWL